MAPTDAPLGRVPHCNSRWGTERRRRDAGHRANSFCVCGRAVDVVNGKGSLGGCYKMRRCVLAPPGYTGALRRTEP